MLSAIFSHRVRGFRTIEVIAVSLLAAMVLGVYLAKTFAGGERSQIAEVERQIADEKARIRLLDAEVAHLERPKRVARLAEGYLQLKPIDAARETSVDNLPTVAVTPVKLKKEPAT